MTLTRIARNLLLRLRSEKQSTRQNGPRQTQSLQLDSSPDHPPAPRNTAGLNTWGREGGGSVTKESALEEFSCTQGAMEAPSQRPRVNPTLLSTQARHHFLLSSRARFSPWSLGLSMFALASFSSCSHFSNSPASMHLPPHRCPSTRILLYPSFQAPLKPHLLHSSLTHPPSWAHSCVSASHLVLLLGFFITWGITFHVLIRTTCIPVQVPLTHKLCHLGKAALPL